MIYFVGIHNKSGKLPLDRTTKTGKVIDQIIDKLSLPCTKTNMCAVDEFPQNEVDIMIHKSLWHQRCPTTKKDVVVLLGGWVRENFNRKDIGPNIVQLTHPAGMFRSKEKTINYINNAVIKIQTKLAEIK